VINDVASQRSIPDFFPKEKMPTVIPLLFDTLFATMSGFVPVPFLRALSYHESSLNPNAVTKSSNATGLFQVVATVLKDYNLQHGTSYTLDDTKDPALNSKIGIGLITRIVRSYQKNHPNTLGMDWKNPRYVELVVQGFNAGYSEAGGVGFVVGQMEKIGIPAERITVDTVSEAAKQLKVSRFLSVPERVGYAKAVSRTYFEQLARDEAKAKGRKLPQVYSSNVDRHPFVKAPDESYDGSLHAGDSALPSTVGVLLSSQNSSSSKPATIENTLGNTVCFLMFPFIPLAGIFIASRLNKRRAVRHSFI